MYSMYSVLMARCPSGRDKLSTVDVAGGAGLETRISGPYAPSTLGKPQMRSAGGRTVTFSLTGAL